MCAYAVIILIHLFDEQVLEKTEKTISRHKKKRKEKPRTTKQQLRKLTLDFVPLNGIFSAALCFLSQMSPTDDISRIAQSVQYIICELKTFTTNQRGDVKSNL